MNFYCIKQGTNNDIEARVELLKRACDDRNVNFVDLDSEAVDYSQIQQPTGNDFLYNVGRGSQILESLMLNEAVTTFYASNPKANFNLANTSTLWTIIHDKEKLPAPKTVHSLTDDRRLLKKYVEYLGGFPLIIKAVGSTRGVGVIKVDSLAALYSIADYLISLNGKFILRQFIECASRLRLVVLGNKVITSVEYISPQDDFRTIEDYPETKVVKAPAIIEQTAVKSVEAIGVEIGGVDIVLDAAGNHYLLEVNFPFSFQRPQKYSKVDIAGLMLDHLIEKQKRRF